MEFPIDKIIVAIFGIFGMGFVYWFFLMKKDEVVEVHGSIDILVKGGYSPSTIEIPRVKTSKINFLRKDESSCLEEVILSDFKIKKFLPLNKKITIEIRPEKAGEFNFTCGMNMFHGKVIVS